MARKKNKKEEPGVQVLARNKQARRRWQIDDTFEAGLVLTGSEIKSLRARDVQIADAYASFRDGELWLMNLHIGAYKPAAAHLQHEPMRPRKLLMRGDQLRRLQGKLLERGFSLIPLDVHLRDGWAKCQLGLGRGKSSGDRREDIKKRDSDREMSRALRRRR